jgi:hypothetical protein
MVEMFKLACVSYKPSLVVYRNAPLTRKHLINMRRTLIDKCEEQINHPDWTKETNSLKTARIFKDLMQYQTMHLNEGSATDLGVVTSPKNIAPIHSYQTLQPNNFDLPQTKR